MTRRLVLSYLAVTVVVLVILQVPLAIVYEQRERDRLTVDTERDAVVMATIYEEALEEEMPVDVGPAERYAQRTGVRVVVVDTRGISIVDTGAETPRDFSTRPEIETALTGTRSSGTRFSETLSTDLLYVSVPAASGGIVHGAVRLTIDVHELNERVMRFRLGMVAVAAVVLVVMAGVGWLIARSVARPVRRLQDAAGRFAAGDLAPISPSRRAPGEIADLEGSLNSMAGQLDELLQRQRAFVADASHQLRTPLTALRLRLENALGELEAQRSTDHPGETHRASEDGHADNGAPSDPVDRELDAAIDETSRLATLVDDLLVLARAERAPTPTTVELARLAADRVGTWSTVAEDSNVTITMPTPPPTAHARAISGAPEQVLDNLLDNALKVSPVGSTLTVTLDREGQSRDEQWWVLTVADQGPGLTDGERERAVERFWRGSNDGEGSGLGLSIVTALAEASGGSFALHANTPSGMRAVVRFPTADADESVEFGEERVE